MWGLINKKGPVKLIRLTELTELMKSDNYIQLLNDNLLNIE